MTFNPGYKVKSSTKELREFTIKGKKVMAYSKKDAIQRLKHKNESNNNKATVGILDSSRY